MRWHVISAVFWRNVKQYFSGVLGYLFLVVFVMVCAIMTFSERFFADNLSNLDQLSQWYPLLLIGFVAAITMTVWAEERRQGTDAILFTLPATDLEILLGKYFSVCAVYTIALLFSMTQLLALNYIGNPDWGVVGGDLLWLLVGRTGSLVDRDVCVLVDQFGAGCICARLAILFDPQFSWEIFSGKSRDSSSNSCPRTLPPRFQVRWAWNSLASTGICRILRSA